MGEYRIKDLWSLEQLQEEYDVAMQNNNEFAMNIVSTLIEKHKAGE